MCASGFFDVNVSQARREREETTTPLFFGLRFLPNLDPFSGLLFVAYSKDTTLERKNPCFFAKLDARDTDDGKSNDPVGFRDAEHKRLPVRSFSPISANDSSGLY